MASLNNIPLVVISRPQKLYYIKSVNCSKLENIAVSICKQLKEIKIILYILVGPLRGSFLIKLSGTKVVIFAKVLI